MEDVCTQIAVGEVPQYPKRWTRLRVPIDFGYLAGRAVFVTDTGIIGLGATHIEEGDIVTILTCESLPIVLRERPGEIETNKMVDTAYIDGLMDNEWLDEYLVAETSRRVPTVFLYSVRSR